MNKRETYRRQLMKVMADNPFRSDEFEGRDPDVVERYNMYLLYDVHPWDDDVLDVMVKKVPKEDMYIYIRCIDWAAAILNHTGKDIKRKDSVFKRTGVVSHLYALFYLFPSLDRTLIDDEIHEMVWMVDRKSENDNRWTLFHTPRCAMMKKGEDECTCKKSANQILDTMRCVLSGLV